MDWKELFTSPAAITLYVAVVLFVYRKLQISHKFDVERWEGLVTTAFLIAEKSGLKTGNEKLDFAIKEFTKQFQITHGKDPSPLDLKDAALDFGRLALQLKFKPTA